MTAMSPLMGLSLAGQRFPGESGELLSALFKSSTVGVAICDRQLRYRAVNDALASMNGIPAEAHLGRTIHAVLGAAAGKIQTAFEQVFRTGRPLSNVEVTAELRLRGTVGHWNESYFPIRDGGGEVLQVGAVVLELTKRREIEASLLRLTNHLKRIVSGLCDESSSVNPKFAASASARSIGFRAPYEVLLRNCLSEARVISQMMHDAPSLTALQPVRRLHRSKPRAATGGGCRNFATASPIEDELRYMTPLSEREVEITALLTTGNSNKEIGSKLGISTRTVESHRARIMLKLGLHSLSDLVRYAVRIQLIDA